MDSNYNICLKISYLNLTQLSLIIEHVYTVMLSQCRGKGMALHFCQNNVR